MWAKSGNADASFLQSAGQAMEAAVQLSSAVKDRTPKVAVRAYSESVIADSHQIHQRLLHLASRNGVTIPVRLNEQQSAARKQLSQTAPARLDEQYARAMISQEQQTIAQFRQEAQNGSDPLVKEFARNTLPTLQGLLSQAREIADSERR
jgi:putative membrane protein